ncbi:hypothetical protein CC2G_012745 [Coprinopsis cinerea AmutBmut pab1-1]|nr:hypothetical protein CC2G_012745 [Coprinopsis cinerea AmutBmut pab1-1]
MMLRHAQLVVRVTLHQIPGLIMLSACRPSSQASRENHRQYDKKLRIWVDISDQYSLSFVHPVVKSAAGNAIARNPSFKPEREALNEPIDCAHLIPPSRSMDLNRSNALGRYSPGTFLPYVQITGA